MAEVTLCCALVGAQEGVFPVTVDANKLVGGLKEAIKIQSDGFIKASHLTLELFLGKMGNAWLDGAGVADVTVDESGVVSVLDKDGNRYVFVKMDPWLKISNRHHFGEKFQPDEDQVHVVVVVPKSPASGATAATAPLTAEQMKMVVNEVLEEREKRHSVYSISTCTRSKEERLVRKLGYKYSTIDVVEEIDASVDPYTWQDNVAEDNEDQRTGYKQYFKDNLQGVLNQGESRTTPSRASPRIKPKYYLKDTSQTRNLLDCDVPSSLPFGLRGTTDLMIVDEAAYNMDEVFAGLQFVIELKDHCGAKERCQILLELVVADLKSENRCAPIGLLTNLNDYWYFLWFTPDREIARMTLRCPANGLKMVKEVLTGTTQPSTVVFPTRIRFLSGLPLLKRQKLAEAAPAGDDSATEMLERYELMSDELSPEFLLARRMEYEFQMVRDMPIHSGMYS